MKLFSAGITQKQISQETGLSQNAVLNTVAYRYHNQIIQDYIAKILNESAEILWGENYAPVWRQSKKRHQSAEPAETP